MPHYDYVCTACAHEEEILQKMTDIPLTICPQCHQATFKRKIGMGLGLQFQGSGFYETDYGSKAFPASSEKASEKASEKEKPPSPSSGGCGCGKSSCSA